jgi:HD superfamily phosphohydrolase
MTGTTYGNFALQRILSSMELDEKNDRIVISGEKGQIAVEDYLFARYAIYAQVYYHKKNLAAKGLLRAMVQRARELAPQLCFVDELILKLLQRKPLSTAEYLCLDDIQLTYHIKRWAADKDAILADLASRFLDRRIFKAVHMPLQFEIEEEIIRKAKQMALTAGFDPQYYITVESTGFRPYDYYRPDADQPATSIMVRTDDGTIKELSEISIPVAALRKENFIKSWLIFPEEIASKISSIKELAAYV